MGIGIHIVHAHLLPETVGIRCCTRVIEILPQKTANVAAPRLRLRQKRGPFHGTDAGVIADVRLQTVLVLAGITWVDVRVPRKPVRKARPFTRMGAVGGLVEAEAFEVDVEPPGAQIGRSAIQEMPPVEFATILRKAAALDTSQEGVTELTC